MCMMFDPGNQNLFHLTPERDDETPFSGDEDDDDDDDEEEGGNRGDRRTVAFPRVTNKKEVMDAPQEEIGQISPEYSDLRLSSLWAHLRCYTMLPVTVRQLITS